MTYDDTMPKYGRIKRDLLHKIHSGALGPGDPVPGELALATEYGVSRASSRLALRDLAMEGYLVRAKGRGSHGADPSLRPRRALSTAHGTLAFVMPNDLSPTACSVFQEFAGGAAQRGFAALAIPVEDVASFERADGSRNLSCFGGIVLWSSGCDVTPVTPSATVRVYAAQPSRFEERQDGVVLPHADATEALTMELVRQGHRRIGLVAPGGVLGDACEAACLRVQRRTGGPACATVRIDAAQHSDPGAATTRLLAQPRRPTAILCSVDGYTENLIGALRRLGYGGSDTLTLATIDRAATDVKHWPRIRVVYAPKAVADQCLASILRRVEQPDAPPHVAHVHAPIDEVTATIYTLSRAESQAAPAQAAGQ